MIIINILEEYLDFAKNIAYQAGDIIRKYFVEDNGTSYKYDQTIVTKADKEINRLLIEKVKKKYPTHSVDGEEEQFGQSDYMWVCDPVDGTSMYARHIPVAVFSLALVIKEFQQLVLSMMLLRIICTMPLKERALIEISKKYLLTI